MSDDLHTLDIDGLSEPLVVNRVRGTERVHAPFSVEVLTHTGRHGARTPLDPEKILGAKADLTVVWGGASRHVRGVVDGVRMLHDGFAFELAPRLAALGRSVDYRVYVEQDPLSIAKATFSRHQLDVKDQVGTAPAARRQVVQSFETDLAFAQRILAEEGIAMFVDATGAQDLVVLSDHASSYAPMPGGEELAFAPHSGHDAGEAALTATLAAGMTPDRVVLRDYDFEHPRVDQTVDVQRGAGLIELYEYRGGYTDPSVGKARAQMRLDEASARAVTLRVRTNSVRLSPGYTFKLTGAPRDDMNSRWVVLEIAYEARVALAADRREALYIAEVVAAPADVTYRPGRPRAAWAGPAQRESPLTLPSPRSAAALSREIEAWVQREPAQLTRDDHAAEALLARPAVMTPVTRGGVETATTTGAAGEEIHTDTFGRGTMQHRWDRLGKLDDKSSTWIRPLQPATSGGVMLPRVGWEVLAAFEGTSGDEPFELGRLINGAAPPAESLPGKKTRSAFGTPTTPGGAGSNVYRTDDLAGAEQQLLQASRDLLETIQNDKNERIQSDHVLDVTGARKHHVGIVYEVKVDGSQTYTVHGQRELHATGAITLQAVDETVAIGGLRYVRTGGSYQSQVGGSFLRIVVGAKMENAIEAQNRHTTGASVLVVGDTWAERGALVARNVGGASMLEVKNAMTVTAGKYTLKAGGITESYDSMTLDAAAERKESYEGAGTYEFSGDLAIEGQNVLFHAEEKIQLKVGSVTILIEENEIKVDGPFHSQVRTIVKGKEKNSG